MSVASELFESYEHDFNQISQSISAKINSTIPSQSGEKRKVTVRATEREIDEADEIIGQMEMEVLNLQPSTRTRLQAKMRNYKSTLEKLKRDLKKASANDSGPTDRDELLNGTERLADSSRRLQESHRIALETETIGANVLDDIPHGSGFLYR
ncbi:8187_t:CDS:2 [Cetraspora pellucida]|uniref:8187_t:CDS:1 n=1 Tax=Cetraspora pellucida TaxID=1433469 RepID=A0ACA9L440_9GLOM|nr:8187_t:CDS:2 [Cetraspora pellucida]